MIGLHSEIGHVTRQDLLQSILATACKHTLAKFRHAVESKQHQNNDNKNNANTQFELIQRTITLSRKRTENVFQCRGEGSLVFTKSYAKENVEIITLKKNSRLSTKQVQ